MAADTYREKARPTLFLRELELKAEGLSDDGMLVLREDEEGDPMLSA